MDFRGISEFLKDTSKYIIVIMLAFIFFVYICGLMQVLGPSMQPTLKEKDVIIVNKILYRFKNINRNDVITIIQNEKSMIKRVVGLPGEYIEYKDNFLYVNGIKYKETFINDVDTTDFKLEDICKELCIDKVIPEGYYLVLGDNRQNSQDSRNFGLISKDEIIGKAWIKVWPINEFKLIK